MKYVSYTFLFFVLANIGLGQSLLLGTVTNPISVKCTNDFAQGSTCTQVIVQNCPGTSDLTVTIGYKRGKGLGTITLFSGEGGTTLTNTEFAQDYNNYGFDTRQRKWQKAWEGQTEPPNILVSACHEATLQNYLANISTQPYCEQGKSGGSSAIVYSLVWYGIGPLVTHASLLSGPPQADIEQGCEVPKPNPVTVTPTNGNPFDDGLEYVTTFVTPMSTFTGYTCQPPEDTTQTANASWLSQSIIQPGGNFSFTTTVSGFVCNNGLNNSAGQASLFYDMMSPVSYSLTAISNCLGPEGVEEGMTPQGVKGQIAIEEDMENQCKLDVKNTLKRLDKKGDLK